MATIQTQGKLILSKGELGVIIAHVQQNGHWEKLEGPVAVASHHRFSPTTIISLASAMDSTEQDDLLNTMSQRDWHVVQHEGKLGVYISPKFS